MLRYNTFIYCGDFYLPGVLWSNDNNGLIYSSFQYTRINCVRGPGDICSLEFIPNSRHFYNSFGSVLYLIFVSQNEFSVNEAFYQTVQEHISSTVQ